MRNSTHSNHGHTSTSTWQGLLLGCAGLTLLQPAWADAEADTKPVETVVVTGQAVDGYRVSTFDMGPLGNKTALELPYAVQTVSQDLMRNLIVDENAELLKYLPSTQIEYRGGSEVGRPQSRGFEADLLGNTRIDGFAVQSHVPQPIELTDHLDVLQGLSGALYGPMNPAGVFNYVLKKPTDETHIEVGSEYRSGANGTVRADVGGRVTLAKDFSIGYRGNVGYMDGATYVEGSDLHRKVEGLSFDVKLPTETKVSVSAAQYVYRGTGLPGAFSVPTGATATIPDADDIDPTKAGYGYPWAGARTNIQYYETLASQSIGENWTVTGGFLWQNVTRILGSVSNALTSDGTRYKQTASQSFMHTSTLSNQAYLNGRFSIYGIENDLTLGTNGYFNPGYTTRNTVATATTTSAGCSAITATDCALTSPVWNTPGGFSRTGISTHYQTLIIGDTIGFGALSLTGVYSNGWIYKGNANVKAVTDIDDANSYSVGATYKILANASVYANYASSVNPDPGQAPSTAANAYEFLAPFRSTQYEIGTKMQIAGLDITVDYFHIRRPTAWTGADKIYKYQGNQTNQGLEFMARGKLTDDITIFGGATWIATNVAGTDTAATNDKPAVGVPGLQANLLTEYRVPGPIKGVSASVNLHYTGSKSANTYNTTRADGYATVDIGLRYTGEGPAMVFSPKYTVRLGVNNLFDERYWASIFPGSIDGSGTTSGASAFVGEPRTIKLSLSLGL